jgi:integrase
MPKRRRLAKGIYEDKYGISVIYRSGGRNIETRFARGYSVERLERWRTRQIETKATPAPTRNQLARDAVRYLKRLKGLPGYKSEKSHLKAWLHEFGPTTRAAVTRERCELILAKWRQHGYAARSLRHRYRILQSLYRFLDGRHAATPLDDIKMPANPKPRPVSVADGLIEAVALELRKHEISGTLRDAKTRARFLVLATTGRRPAEVMRAERADLDLEQRLWFTRTAKGGANTMVYLNDEMVAAWELFVTAQAWGDYDCRSFSKTLKRAGWPARIRPYNLRHTAALSIRARGGDLEDVQDQLGHASIDTARAFYLSAIPARQKATSARLAGRFSRDAFLP